MELKSKIRSTQIKAAVVVNSTFIQFNWELGKMIAEKQTAWGSKFLETLSKDLQDEFPDMKGFLFQTSNFANCFIIIFQFVPMLRTNWKIVLNLSTILCHSLWHKILGDIPKIDFKTLKNEIYRLVIINSS